jgi:hypothetical protein
MSLVRVEKDLLAFLLNFPQLRLERTSSVYLSDKKAADLGFVDCSQISPGQTKEVI